MPRCSRRHVLRASLVLAGVGVLTGCRGQLDGAAEVPRVGWLGVSGQAVAAPFREELRDLGYVEGRDLVIEARHVDGELGRLPEHAASLVRLPVAVIVAQGTAAIRAAKDATTATPIVMAQGNSPVENGFVASLARPGGNITGVTTLFRELVGKRLELLQAAVPGLSSVACLWNPSIADRVRDLAETQEAARALGLELRPLAARDERELAGALGHLAAHRPDAVLLLDNAVLDTHQSELAEFALAARLPMMAAHRSYVVAGGLMSYGPSLDAMVRGAAAYVDRILKGAKPADLPIEQPATFDFPINLGTAQALGPTIPPSVLAQATEVIQ